MAAAPNDPNLMFWEPTKWVAKLRHERTDDAPALLRELASHGGSTGRYEAVADVAFAHSFLIGR